ncbi:MAG: hypothetical protein ABFR62_01810 [Bacteroidota bacterium]
MKNILTALFLFYSIGLFAQKKLSTYKVDYLGKKFDIGIIQKADDYNLHINGWSVDQLSDNGGIIIDKKDHKTFLENLEIAREKYMYLSDYTKDKKLKRFTKKINVKPIKIRGYFDYGDLRFDNDIKPYFEFNVFTRNNVVHYLLMVKTGILTDSQAKGVESDGIVIVMSSLYEIDEFINKVSTERVESFNQKNEAQKI